MQLSFELNEIAQEFIIQIITISLITIFFIMLIIAIIFIYRNKTTQTNTNQPDPQAQPDSTGPIDSSKPIKQPQKEADIQKEVLNRNHTLAEYAIHKTSEEVQQMKLIDIVRVAKELIHTHRYCLIYQDQSTKEIYSDIVNTATVFDNELEIYQDYINQFRCDQIIIKDIIAKDTITIDKDMGFKSIGSKILKTTILLNIQHRTHNLRPHQSA